MKRSHLSIGSALAGVCLCPAVHAQPAAEPAPSIQAEAEARLAAQLPLGQSQQGQTLQDEVELTVPVGLGLGARLFEVLYVGIDGAIGPAVMGDVPPDNGPCSPEYLRGERCRVKTYRATIMLGYQLVNRSRWEPWLRIGLGHERVRFAGNAKVRRVTDPNAPASLSDDVVFALHGWVVQTRLGADYVATPHFRFGGFVSFDAGVYTRRVVDYVATTANLPIQSVDIEQRAGHYWIGGGVRAAFVGP